MNKQIKFANCRYFSWLVIFIEWLMILLLFILFKLSIDMPISQVTALGTNLSIKLITRTGVIIATSSFYLFSLYLDNFWERSSITSIIGGLSMALAMFIPYNQGLVLSLSHNLLALVALMSYTFVMVKVSNSSSLNQRFRTLTRIIIFSILFSLSLILAHILGLGLLGSRKYVFALTEMIILALVHIWMISISIKKFN